MNYPPNGRMNGACRPASTGLYLSLWETKIQELMVRCLLGSHPYTPVWGGGGGRKKRRNIKMADMFPFLWVLGVGEVVFLCVCVCVCVGGGGQNFLTS